MAFRNATVNLVPYIGIFGNFFEKCGIAPIWSSCPCVRIKPITFLSSKYEGYPVVFVEAMTLNKPIVTTAVSDYREIENRYGIVVENNASAIYDGMKQFLDHGFEISEPFDPQKFNDKMLEIFENLIEGKK